MNKTIKVTTRGNNYSVDIHYSKEGDVTAFNVSKHGKPIFILNGVSDLQSIIDVANTALNISKRRDLKNA